MPEVALYERKLDHAAEVLGGLFKPREDSPTLLQPSDEPFNDIAITVCVAIEFDRPVATVFVDLGWDHWRDR